MKIVINANVFITTVRIITEPEYLTNTQLFEIKVTTVQNPFDCISSNDWVFLKVELFKLYVMTISLFCPIFEYYHP
jgi:hypothetical protein